MTLNNSLVTWAAQPYSKLLLFTPVDLHFPFCSERCCLCLSFTTLLFSFRVVLGKKLRRTLLFITFYCHLMPFLVWMSCKHRARWFRKKNVDGDLKWNREQLSLTNWALFRDKSPSKRRRGISLCIFSLNLRRKSWKWLWNSLQFYFPSLWAGLLWRNDRKMCTKAVFVSFS